MSDIAQQLVQSKKKILDQITGAFFFAASATAKIQSFLAPPLMPFILLSSLLCYLAGYSLWLVASFLAPSHTPRFEEWYGFAEFKEQSGYAAFLGIIAALIALAAFVFPALTIPAAWAFFLSNTFWVISEHHKTNNPHPDDKTPAAKQQNYLYYALSVAIIGLISAATLTLIAFFPPLAIPLLIASTSLNVSASIAAVFFWCNYMFASEPAPSSYNTMKLEFAAEPPTSKSVKHNTSPKQELQPPLLSLKLPEDCSQLSEDEEEQDENSPFYSPCYFDFT